MSAAKQWIKRPPVWATLLILGCIIIWQVWNVSAASQRMSPALREIVAQGDMKVDIVVQLGFKVEGYHINFFQRQQGRVGRIKDQEVLLKRVPTESVTSLARHYWISHIVLASELPGG
jgi:hypothetical protein